MSVTFKLDGQEVDSIPGFGDRVQLSPEVEQSILRHFEDPEYHKFMAAEGMAKRNEVAAVDLLNSPAAKRAARLTANRTLPLRQAIKQVNIPGDADPYFIRVFDPARINFFQQHANRLPDGTFDLDGTDKLASFLAALLYSGVVAGPDDKRPLFKFKREEGDEPFACVWDWVESTDPVIGATALHLQAEIIFHNPEYFNIQAEGEAREALKAAGIDLDAPDPREKKESSPPSSMSGSSMPTVGSESTDSTPEPSNLPASPFLSMVPADTDMATSS